MEKIRNCFDTIIGYESIKNELYKISHILRDTNTYTNKGIQLPSGLLLLGDPGVGKTSMANALIKASERKTYVCKKDKVKGTFTSYIKSTFTRAINSGQPCIILLDDLDKFANDDYEHCDSEEFVVVQSCMDSVKNKDIFIIATVNDIDKLPMSLYRAGRFDTHIFVENPTAEDAEAIVKYYLSNKNVVDLDYRTVSRLLGGASCAQLETVVNEAGILSLYKGHENITMDDVTRACLRIIYDAPESCIVTDPVKRMYIAMHEVGHAVVSDALIPESVNFISVRQHDSEIGGFTDIHDDKENTRAFIASYELNNICVDVAGVEAVKMFLKEVDCGGTADYRNAFNSCCKLVQGCLIYGPEHRFGGSAYGIKDLGRDETSTRKTRKRIVKTIKQEQNRARKILRKNKMLVQKLVEYLMQDDTMTRDKFLNIKNTVLGGRV